VLIDPGAIIRVGDILEPAHFYNPRHAAIFTVMLGMFGSDKKLDTVTILDELRKTGVYDESGGKAYLLQLAQLTPSSANIESYAKIVTDKYYLRSLILAGREIISDATENAGDASLILDSAEQRIYDIRQGRDTTGLKHIGEVLQTETLDRIDKMATPELRAEYRGIPSGFGRLDVLLGGLNKSDLIIVGARPGMGKTSIALNIAQHVAVKEKKTVCFFALEMTRDQLTQRLLSDVSSIDGKKFRDGNISPQEWPRIFKAAQLLSETQIYIDESPAVTVSQMKAKLRRMKTLDLVIIDYLQLMQDSRRYENRVQEVTAITRQLKNMAKELNVPVLVCAQLSRSTEKSGKSHRPVLSDLRESGSIEQDADIVTFIYREIYYRDGAEDLENTNPHEAAFIVAKNRHGETGDVKLYWDGQYTRFTDWENNYE
jgi:replicative DNA helicase